MKKKQESRMRKRKINSYILDWKMDLTKKGYKPQTIQIYLTGLKTFYADHDIELPRIRLNGIIKKEDINDIPSKKIFKKH